MRRLWILATIAALWCGVASVGMAKGKQADKSPADKKTETKAESSASSASAELRAEMHRTMSDLITAQAAKEPDQAKIEKLTKELQEIRKKLQAQGPVAAGTSLAGSGCPWGGPGMGFGRGAGWGGPGQGRGPAWAQGGGQGRGPGWGAGRGPAAGRGMGRGPGGGAGRGFGPGAGMGLAPGGAAFVDKDDDGVCDNYELRHGTHK